MKKIQKLLIANRGEIACRIIKTCRKMGISTVAVYSDIDCNNVFMKLADEAVNIGSSGIETYLNQDKIIDAAKRTGADAIHPGYGLLSENPSFAALCRDKGITFIGPSPESITTMGSKIVSRQLSEKIGIPVIPGFEVSDQSVDQCAEKVLKIGYPILIKASSGGGGVGIFLVEEPSQFENTLKAAKKKSMAMYGNDNLIIEKYLTSVRHVEFQILGDMHGTVIHCFERECSVQRRHQKLIEESPSPAMNEALRKNMGNAAVKIAKAVNYTNTGTVEFVLTEDKSFYFLEMNTRLQVEHPVTEAITGLDLVELQIRIAEGEALGINQDDLSIHGHAIECRIYTEDSENDFNPCTGIMSLWKEASHTRTDSGIQSLSRITIDFDPLIAKVIAHGNTRDDAIRKMYNSLQNTIALGVSTNIDFMMRLLKSDMYMKSEITTDFFEKNLPALYKQKLLAEDAHALLIVCTIMRIYNFDKSDRETGWQGIHHTLQYINFRLRDEDHTICFYIKDKDRYEITINKNIYDVFITDIARDYITIIINGHLKKFYYASENERVFIHSQELGHHMLKYLSRFHSMEFQQNKKGSREAPMDGKILSIMVQPGDKVKKDQELIIIESMKMENIIHADQPGIVKEIKVNQGDFVTMGSILIEIDTENNI